ncbi:MAG TPA: MFS transporter [Alphaproteobacteria bacterium]|nr:MFS transporter [Alphaproteobacteria bacterium]
MSAVASQEAGRNDGTVMALVGSAHFSSHLLQLALAPLFPILHAEFGVGYTELGLIVTLFYVASGFGQAAAGVLVDRYGAHRLLVAGLTTLSIAVALTGLVTSYWMFLPLALIAGLGNSVFHPADLSILSHRVSERRVGRAFALHGISGQLGFATAPVAMTFMAEVGSWRMALVIVGVVGLVVAAVLNWNNTFLVYETKRAAAPHAGGAPRSTRYLEIIGSPVVILAFAYFALTAFGGTGIQTFSIAALTSGFGLTLSVATLGLTAYLIGNSFGLILGGFLADRTQNHHRVAMGGMIVASAMVLVVVALATFPPVVVPVLVAAGLANGLTAPSRDLLIRRAAVGAGMGSVFGFVYSGFDLGSSTAPLVFGALIDNHSPHAVFLIVALAFALAAPTVMQVRRRAVRRASAVAGE